MLRNEQMMRNEQIEEQIENEMRNATHANESQLSSSRIQSLTISDIQSELLE